MNYSFGQTETLVIGMFLLAFLGWVIVLLLFTNNKK